MCELLFHSRETWVQIPATTSPLRLLDSLWLVKLCGKLAAQANVVFTQQTGGWPIPVNPPPLPLPTSVLLTTMCHKLANWLTRLCVHMSSWLANTTPLPSPWGQRMRLGSVHTRVQSYADYAKKTERALGIYETDLKSVSCRFVKGQVGSRLGTKAFIHFYPLKKKFNKMMSIRKFWLWKGVTVHCSIILLDYILLLLDQNLNLPSNYLLGKILVYCTL